MVRRSISASFTESNFSQRGNSDESFLWISFEMSAQVFILQKSKQFPDPIRYDEG